jgi:hypothetical protein
VQKYGLQFEPLPSRAGWFTARDVADQDAHDVASRIHSQFEVGPEMVFCGLSLEAAPNRVYLVESSDPVELVQEFQVGSHAFYDSEVVDKTYRMLAAIYRFAPFTPVFV